MGVDATIYVGGLDEKVTEALLWELFVQAGPIGDEAPQCLYMLTCYTYCSKCTCSQGPYHYVTPGLWICGVCQ